MPCDATYITHSADETVDLGRRLAGQFPVSAVVLLIGNLGAGKTTLTQGIMEGLGVASRHEVASPTFTLIHEYGRVYHIDLYRLDTEAEVATLGLEDLFDRDDSIVLIEWGERFPRLMPADRIEIRLEHSGEDMRRISVTTPSK